MVSAHHHPVVLVVEDEPVTRQTMVRLLAGEGYEARQARSAEEALDIVAECAEPVIALVDLDLPGMNGLELISFLTRPGIGVRPILITASGDDDLLWQVCKQPAVTYMRKPLNFSMLLRILSDWSHPN